jgi:hypothetical protein
MIPSPAVSNMFHSLLTLWCALAPNTHTHTHTHTHTPRGFPPRIFASARRAHNILTHHTCQHTHYMQTQQLALFVPTARPLKPYLLLPPQASLTRRCLCPVCVRERECVRVCVRTGVCLRTRHARPLNAYFSFPLPHSNTWQSAIEREYRFPIYSLSQYPRLLFFFQIACT